MSLCVGGLLLNKECFSERCVFYRIFLLEVTFTFPKPFFNAQKLIHSLLSLLLGDTQVMWTMVQFPLIWMPIALVPIAGHKTSIHY